MASGSERSSPLRQFAIRAAGAMALALLCGDSAVHVEAHVEDPVELGVALGVWRHRAHLQSLDEQERPVALDAEQDRAQLLDLGLELHADPDEPRSVALARRQ